MEKNNKKKHPHPGGTIRRHIIESKGLTVTKSAQMLKVGRQALSTLLNGHASLSQEMAFKIEKVFGISMELTMKMQLAHDLSKLRLRDNDKEFSVEPYNY